MPEGGDIGFYSNWLDGPRWEDFHLRELPRILADRYGAGPRRAIAGLSMGGLGAMDYAARRPRMFQAAASFSGVLHPLGNPRFWLGLFSSYTSDPDQVWGDPKADRAVWRRHDPTAVVRALAGIPLFVSAGDGRGAKRDAIEAEVGAESRAFVRRASAFASGPRRPLPWRRPRLAVLAARAASRAAAAPRPAPLGENTPSCSRSRRACSRLCGPAKRSASPVRTANATSCAQWRWTVAASAPGRRAGRVDQTAASSTGSPRPVISDCDGRS